MSAKYEVLGHFAKVEEVRTAICKLQEEGYGAALELYSPFPEHSLEDQLFKGRKRSPVRLFVLLGAVFGCLFAFLFTSWMSIDYPLRVSAKPLLSVPAFIIIAFECTILFGAFFTVGSMSFFSAIPNWLYFPSYRPKFSEGTFGLAVRVKEDQTDGLKEYMKSFGAQLVEVVYVR